MAEFPIQYAGGKLRGTPLPRAHIDTRTGVGQVARQWGKLGEFLFEKGQEIQKTQDAVELSSMKRKYDEIMFAAYNTFSATSDPTIRNGLFQQAMNDVEMISSERENVNNAYQVHVNNTINNWQQNFAVKDIAIRKQNVKDEALANIQSALEKGDLLGAGKSYSHLKRFNIISQAEYDVAMRELPARSVLAQARIMLDSNPTAAIEMLTEPSFVKSLSGEMLDYKDKLLRMAKQQSMIITDAIQNEITFGMFENRNLTLVEKAVLGEQYINKLRTTPGLSAENARVMVNRVQDWMEGKEREFNLLNYENVRRAINDLRADKITQKQALNVLYENIDKIDDSRSVSLLDEIYKSADPEDITRDPLVKHILGEFEELETKGYFIGIDPKEMSHTDWAENKSLGINYRNKFIQELRKQPDISDREIEDLYNNLLTPINESRKKDWIEKILNPLGWESGTAASYVYKRFFKEKTEMRFEEMPEAERRISVISPDGVKGDIPENQRDAAVAAGYTIVE